MLWPRSKRLLHIFFSRIFLASCLTFRSFIHFDFIFVYGVRKWSRFVLLHVTVQFSQHHLLKRLSFSIGYSFLLCQRLVGYTFVGPFLGFLSVPLICVSVFVPVPYCLDDYSFVIQLKSGIVILPALVFFFKILCYLESFMAPYKF